MKNKKRERALALACCAAMAALMLLFTSQCSPLYPINVWGDANCLLTVGRVMKRGGVLYRDIYEQKGPLLYLIHAAAACLSDTSFLGVYLMEIPALTAALYAAYRLMRLRAGSAFALGAAAVFGALATTGGSFMRGDSAEEFCLPLLTAALAIAYAEYGRRAKPRLAYHGYRHVFLHHSELPVCVGFWMGRCGQRAGNRARSGCFLRLCIVVLPVHQERCI